MSESRTRTKYTYDPVGNRLSSLGVSPYSYNSSNELTSTPSATYTYDKNGSMLTKMDSTGTTQYAWDYYTSKLDSVTLPGSGGTVSFKYDAFGRRAQKSFTQGSTTTTTNYLYDGVNLLEEVDNTGIVIARYVRSRRIDEQLAVVRGSTTSYYHQDGLESVSSLSTATGTLANTYAYDGYGRLTNSSGTIANRFQFTGRELDQESGLYYYRARYYDPSVGHFLSEDPVKFNGGINFYRYVKNTPINLFDPFGLSPSSDVAEEYDAYVACRDERQRQLYPGARAAEACKQQREYSAPFNPEEGPEIPSETSAGDMSDFNASSEARQEAAADCLKEHPLAGMDKRFIDIDVGEAFEPSWDTTTINIFNLFFQ